MFSPVGVLIGGSTIDITHEQCHIRHQINGTAATVGCTISDSDTAAVPVRDSIEFGCNFDGRFFPEESDSVCWRGSRTNQRHASWLLRDF